MRSVTIGVLLVLLLGCGGDSNQILSPPAPPAECEADLDCDDGVWCNGTESCSQGSCLAPTPPCVGDCDEAGQACTYEITASFLASTFEGEPAGDCLAIGPPAADPGEGVRVHPQPDDTLVRVILATARAGDVVDFSQLFRQNPTSGSRQTYSCHFNVLLGQELALIEQGSCQTDSGNLECTVTFSGIVISDL